MSDARPERRLAAILAAAHAALGEYDKREAGMTLARLRQPSIVSPRVTDAVLDGLRKAGMKEQ
jgi:hypothetical protein